MQSERMIGDCDSSRFKVGQAGQAFAAVFAQVGQLGQSLLEDEVEGEKRERGSFSHNERWPGDEAAKTELLQPGKEESCCYC